MICLDSSEWMRNGDYLPSRLEAQQDAAGLISTDRTSGVSESACQADTLPVLATDSIAGDVRKRASQGQLKISALKSKITRLGGIHSDLDLSCGKRKSRTLLVARLTSIMSGTNSGSLSLGSEVLPTGAEVNGDGSVGSVVAGESAVDRAAALFGSEDDVSDDSGDESDESYGLEEND